MTRLKVGVLTFHRCINYGSYWQARCLVEGLCARGHDAVLLDHTSPGVNQREWACAFQPVLPTPVPRADYPRYGLKMLKFFRVFEELPLSAPFALENPAAMDEYDVVVVGSDEVWNLRHPWYSGCTLFYGLGLRASRVVSYAASFGNYPASAGLEPFWADLLRRFDCLAVRDENSRQLIEAALDITPCLVLDPCLQFDAPTARYANTSQKPYVAVYGHNFTPAFSQQLRQWAATQGYELVSIGYRNDWADRQWLTAGPHQFAQFIAQASAVATNFFHGCVFSLRYGRPFACELSDYRSHKVRDLMRLLDGENHLMSADAPPEAYAASLSQPIQAKILDCIATLRQQSSAYLDRAVG